MKENRNWNRLISVTLALAMVFILIPVNATKVYAAQNSSIYCPNDKGNHLQITAVYGDTVDYTSYSIYGGVNNGNYPKSYFYDGIENGAWYYQKKSHVYYLCNGDHHVHDFSPATCTEAKKCLVGGCEATKGNAKGHDYDYTADGATLTASCNRAAQCGMEDASLTLVATTQTYSGSEIGITDITDLEEFNTVTNKSLSPSDVKY